MKTTASLENDSQTFVDHLTELRTRLIRILIIVFGSSVAAFYFSSEIFDILRAPIESYLPNNQGLVFTAPADKFMAYLQISVFAGIILSSPLWFYQIWKFIAPGLYTNEKKLAAYFILSGSALFVTGILFAFYGALPAAFEFLMGFGNSKDTPMLTIDAYISFVVWMVILFGVAFELPLIIVMLGLLGFVSSNFLRKNRRFIVVFLAVLAGVLTPSPDLASMLIMFVPLVVLFEISVFIVSRIEKSRTLAS